jgi:hypothetical protein
LIFADLKFADAFLKLAGLKFVVAKFADLKSTDLKFAVAKFADLKSAVAFLNLSIAFPRAFRRVIRACGVESRGTSRPILQVPFVARRAIFNALTVERATRYVVLSFAGTETTLES